MSSNSISYNLICKNISVLRNCFKSFIVGPVALLYLRG